jgi:hypothetical protein
MDATDVQLSATEICQEMCISHFKEGREGKTPFFDVFAFLLHFNAESD